MKAFATTGIASGIGILVFAASMHSSDVRAEVYKCVATDGSATYSQLPCKGNPQTIEIDIDRPSRDLAAADCRPAYRFAYQAASAMQEGASSRDVFDRYGGLNSISPGVLNIVNFVFGYRASDSVSAQQLAGQVQSKCQAGALEEVFCEDLPVSFTDNMGGCETGQVAPTSVNASAGDASQELPPDPAATPADVASGEVSRSCTEDFQYRLDLIEELMDRGGTPAQRDVFEKQRQQIKAQMRHC